MKFGKCRYRLMPRIYIHVHMDAGTVNPKIENLQGKLLASRAPGQVLSVFFSGEISPENEIINKKIK